jgi:probable addiction module antidote protein
MVEPDSGKSEHSHQIERSKLSPYDTADYLKNEDDIATYLEAVMEDGDPALIADAQEIVARARVRIAKTGGTKREEA